MSDLFQGREQFVIIPSQDEDTFGRVGYYCNRSWETVDGAGAIADFVASDEIALMRWVAQAIVGCGTLNGSADAERQLLEAVLLSIPKGEEELQ
jgi:hypothetical protein